MNINHKEELPDSLKSEMKKAVRIEWVTVFYLLSVIFLMYLTLGSSQAMKTAWLEDLLSIVPAISFLIAQKFYNRKPTESFPYGFHKAFTLAQICGSLALFGMGIFLVFDSSMSLILREHPTIGTLHVFGHQVWFGWLMILALLYSSIPAFIIGQKKLPTAKKLHNEILFTDAEAQKADYMTAGAAILGILGVGMGFWWADSTAALFISFSVLKDGFSTIKESAFDVLDHYPQTVGSKKPDDLILEVKQTLRVDPAIEDFYVRMREHGQVYFGEIMVVMKSDTLHASDLENIKYKIKALDWKLFGVEVVPVSEIVR